MSQLTNVKLSPAWHGTRSDGLAGRQFGFSIRGAVWVVALAMAWLAHAATPPGAFEDSGKWMMFTSKAGWSIKYPGTLKVGSCRQCQDPAAADSFVVFRDPATGETMMIEPLEEKSSNSSTAQWLQELSRTTVANSRVSEEWIYLDGRPALKVINTGADSVETSNIYLVDGSKTFAIHVSGTHKALYEQMLSTFRF